MRVLVKILLFVICTVLMSVNSGCTSKQVYTRSIDSEQITKYGQFQQGLSAFFRIGDTIEVFAKEAIQLPGMKFESLKLVVKDTDLQRIKGKVVDFCCDPSLNPEQVVNQVVEVNLDDIERISIWKKQTSLSGVSWILIALIVLAVGAQACGTNLGECLFPF